MVGETQSRHKGFSSLRNLVVPRRDQDCNLSTPTNLSLLAELIISCQSHFVPRASQSVLKFGKFSRWKNLLEQKREKGLVSRLSERLGPAYYADGFKVLTCCLSSKISMVRAPAAQGGSGKVNYELYA